VRRSEYVLSRWIAVALAAATVAALQVLAASLLLAARGAAPELDDAALFAAQRVLECFGLAAVFAMLSSLVGGLGDLGVYVVAMMTTAILQMVGQFQGSAVLARAGAEIMGFLRPSLDLAQLAGASPMPLFPIVSFLSTTALALLVAVLLMNRRELSYASSG
jgi:ABC-type transport system involved in multi-copper enzyme maturation permease subunit